MITLLIFFVLVGFTLLGVPIAIKDELDIAGEVATHGTRGYSEPASEDSEHVRRLTEAGAIVLGKTHLPELAIFGFWRQADLSQDPTEEWNLDRHVETDVDLVALYAARLGNQKMA